MNCCDKVRVGSLPVGTRFKTALTHRAGLVLQRQGDFGADSSASILLEGPSVLLTGLQNPDTGEQKVLHPDVVVLA